MLPCLDMRHRGLDKHFLNTHTPTHTHTHTCMHHLSQEYQETHRVCQNLPEGGREKRMCHPHLLLVVTLAAALAGTAFGTVEKMATQPILVPLEPRQRLRQIVVGVEFWNALTSPVAAKMPLGTQAISFFFWQH